MANEDEAVAAPAPSRLPMIIGMVVAFAVGAGAGFGAATALASEGEPDEEVVGEGAEVPPPPTRAVHSLGKFTVNLRGAGGGRVLRTEVAVDVSSTDLPVVEAGTALLRDAIITLASDYSFADVEGLDGKTRLRDEMLTRLNALLPDGHIDRVYFTEFVVQ